MQLHRWVKAGKVLALRRGLYTLADPYRRVSLSPLKVANELCRPSYLSGIWALGFYGLIPEKIILFSSATTRVTRSFQNPFGTFRYSSLKKEFFWGFSARTIQGSEIWIANPEKALLDFWHLSHGEWTQDRLSEMRFQHGDNLDMDKLSEFTRRWGTPRLSRATSRYQELASAAPEGRVAV